MPNAIKYNTSTESLSLKKNNFYIGSSPVTTLTASLTMATGVKAVLTVALMIFEKNPIPQR